MAVGGGAMPRAVDIDEHDEELAQRFDEMEQLERAREAQHRAEGMPHLCALRSTYAHAWMLAAKMLREDIAERRARREKCGRAA